MPVVAVAPCQCLTPGAIQTTSPGRISSTGPPSRCTQPIPAVTTSTWPSGCVCQAVRAPGSKVTSPPDVREGAVAENRRSTRTAPVKLSAGPLPEGSEPTRAILTAPVSSPGEDGAAPGPGAAVTCARTATGASSGVSMTDEASRLISVLLLMQAFRPRARPGNPFPGCP